MVQSVSVGVAVGAAEQGGCGRASWKVLCRCSLTLLLRDFVAFVM